MAEILSKRSWDAKVFDTGKKQGSKPVLGTLIQNGLHDIEPDGSFVECNNVLIAEEVDGTSHRVTRGRYGSLRMSNYNDQSRQEITLLHKSGNGIKLKYEQSRTYGPFTDTIRKLRYNTDNGATIYQTATYKGCNLILSIANPQTDSNEYKFSITPVGNYTYEENNGQITCINDQGDNIYIKATYVKDANDNYGPVTLRLAERIGNKQYFIKIIDLDWLRSAVGPVECDPSVTIDDDTGTLIDTWIRSDQPNGNSGTAPTLNLYWLNPTRYTALMQVDLTAYTGIDITSARFGLDIFTATNVDLRWSAILKDWVEGAWSNPASIGDPTWDYQIYNTVLWNTSGCLGIGSDISSTLEGSATANVSSDFHIDMTTATVQDWIDTPSSNNGILYYNGTQTGAGSIQIRSSDTSLGNKPYFYMEYTEGGKRTTNWLVRTKWLMNKKRI